LEQPYKLLNIFEQLVIEDRDHHGDVLKSLISSFPEDRLLSCLHYIRDWNTNAKHSALAQTVLKCILCCFTPSYFESKPKMKAVLEILIVYSERHFQRVDKLLQKSFLIDYTLQQISLTPNCIPADVRSQPQELNAPENRKRSFGTESPLRTKVQKSYPQGRASFL